MLGPFDEGLLFVCKYNKYFLVANDFMNRKSLFLCKIDFIYNISMDKTHFFRICILCIIELNFSNPI